MNDNTYVFGKEIGSLDAKTNVGILLSAKGDDSTNLASVKKKLLMILLKCFITCTEKVHHEGDVIMSPLPHIEVQKTQRDLNPCPIKMKIPFRIINTTQALNKLTHYFNLLLNNSLMFWDKRQKTLVQVYIHNYII